MDFKVIFHFVVFWICCSTFQVFYYSMNDGLSNDAALSHNLNAKKTSDFQPRLIRVLGGKALQESSLIDRSLKECPDV